jgi:GntR family transcriptional regulator
MFYINLNKNRKPALYIQLANQIRSAITSGYLRHGDQLPTDEAICEQFNISQIVVKQAYEVLLKEGIIQRVRGRGTFVKSIPSVIIPLNQLNTLEEAYRGLGVERSYNLVELTDHHYLSALYFTDTNPSFWRVVLTGHYEKSPVYLQEFIFPTETFPKLDSILHNPEVDLARLIQDLFRMRVHQVHNELNLENLPFYDAQMLKISSESVAHVVVSAYMNALDEVMFYSRTVYPVQYVSFEYIQEVPHA